MNHNGVDDEIIRQFPPIDFAFAYGSGVVQQSGYEKLDKMNSGAMPMLDLVFAVEDSEQWHRQNMLLNPDHYSPIIPLSARTLAYIQDNFGAGMWYNAMIPLNIRRSPERLMKYGVISKANLIKDLLKWTHLYVAGRLHKPVRVLRSDAEVTVAAETNRMHAVRTALLLLPETFSELQLYLTIAALSYIGDPRVFVGENPRKIVNLVTPVVEEFRALYRAPISELLGEVETVTSTASAAASAVTPPDAPVLRRYVSPVPLPVTSIGTGVWSLDPAVPVQLDAVALATAGRLAMFEQDKSTRARLQLCLHLPDTLAGLLRTQSGGARQHWSLPPTRPAIRTALSTIVARAAGSQSLKGIVSIGVVKGAVYAFEKVKKRFSGHKAVSLTPAPASPR